LSESRQRSALTRLRVLSCRLVLALFLLSLLAGIYLAARVVLYHQSDDARRLQSKRDYLEQISALDSARHPAPNVVVILFDDLGYGDIGAYGGRAIHTPRIDRLAAEGARFVNAYAASPYCSASRAGLMTGRYAVRSGLDHVLQTRGSFRDFLLRVGRLNRRLPAEEITIADVLSAAGYATALVGKWHLGDVEPSLPNDFGFDLFYGLLHSNDQGEPTVWRNRTVVERHPIDQSTLTRRYTAEAVGFIETHRDRPFFLYVPHTFPHIPLHVTADRSGSSEGGLYGDVVEELDESVGAVLDALERTGVADHTLVLISSDNGPWFQGSPGSIRGRKFDVFEGGMRVPLLVAWPERIPAASVLDEPVMLIDLFPTILDLAQLPAPGDRTIDGRSLLPVLEGRDDAGRPPVFFFQLSKLRAVRQGPFKYHDRHGVFFGNPMDWPWGPMRKRGPWLFDLRQDADESYDVSGRYPEVAARLREVLEEKSRQVEDNPRGWL